MRARECCARAENFDLLQINHESLAHPVLTELNQYHARRHALDRIDACMLRASAPAIAPAALAQGAKCRIAREHDDLPGKRIGSHVDRTFGQNEVITLFDRYRDEEMVRAVVGLVLIRERNLAARRGRAAVVVTGCERPGVVGNADHDSAIGYRSAIGVAASSEAWPFVLAILILGGQQTELGSQRIKAGDDGRMERYVLSGLYCMSLEDESWLRGTCRQCSRARQQQCGRRQACFLEHLEHPRELDRRILCLRASQTRRASIKRRYAIKVNSPRTFAARFRMPLGTLRDWEQGRKEPDAVARAYLTVIGRNPSAVAKALHPTA